MAEDLFHHPDDLKHLIVCDHDHRPIGRVEQVYVNDRSRHPEWVSMLTEPHGTEHTFVPLRGAEHEAGGVLRVAYSLETVTAAPRLNADQHLGVAQEQELDAHYGLTPPQDEASGAPGVGRERPKAPLTGAEGEVAEVAELTGKPPAERPRLRKYVPADGDRATAPSTGAHREDR
jgi:hypothetical protein